MGTSSCFFRIGISALLGVVLCFAYSGHAQIDSEKCFTKIVSNDRGISVRVGNNDLEPGQYVVPCQEVEQDITVTSSDGQIFFRVLPAAKDFRISDQVLNVVFVPKEAGVYSGTQSPARVVEKKVVEKLVSSDGISAEQMNRILLELSQMKAMLSELKNSLGEKAVQAIKSPAQRQPATAEKASLLSGIYLQLHSFLTTSWNFLEIHTGIDGVESGKAAQLKFCHKNRAGGKMWTRVYWGPFKNQSSAEAAQQELKGRSLVVKDPQCWEQQTK